MVYYLGYIGEFLIVWMYYTLLSKSQYTLLAKYKSVINEKIYLPGANIL